MGADWMKRVLVAGAGAMGHSIAMVFALGDYQVDLVDLNGEILEKALHLIQSNLQTLKKAKLIDSKSVPKALRRISPSTSLGVASEADGGGFKG